MIHSTTASPNVIIYLPPGPLFQPSHQDDRETGRDLTPQALASITSFTVVTINYRLGEVDRSTAAAKEQNRQRCYKYPIPVHDTLAGFDWTLRNLEPSRLAVFGSHIGGSLALMLALTEAQSVQAVAALDPICDWVGLDDYCTMAVKDIPRRTRKTVPEDLVPLLEMRYRLFRTPSGYFDAFASPVLFLRSAGRDTPRTFPKYLTGSEHPVPVLDLPPGTQDEDDQLALWESYALEEEDLDDDNDAEKRGGVHRRKALLRWPPYGLDYGLGKSGNSSRLGIGRLQMRLPSTCIYVRSDPISSTSKRRTVLARQASEMVSTMRRACFWGQGKSVADESVRLVDAGPGVASIRLAGEWLSEMMSKEDACM